MSDSTLSPQVFLILCRIIEEHAGLHYSENDVELLAAKVTPRAIERGFDSLLDYYYFLRYDPAGPQELAELTERLLVHETYFFREVEPLQTLVEQFIAPLVRSGKRVRVWSAACATGEEPITLATLLAGRDLLGDVELIATDLSERALDRAQTGRFNGRSLRAMPHQDMWSFIDMNGRVAKEITQEIAWRRVNLLDRAAMQALGTFDAILCRNVLIYFSDAGACNVLEGLLAQLQPEGTLLVGVSESLMRFGTLLRCEERSGSFFYRKGAA